MPEWTVVHGYERLVAGIAALPGAVVDDGRSDGEAAGANVVLFGYDFRRSVAEAAEVLAAAAEGQLAGLSASERAGRVIVVAHSLGGLVARYWLGPLGGWRVCRALVTLGTPHRGTPKALDWLVNGVRLAGVADPGLTGLARDWPSAATRCWKPSRSAACAPDWPWSMSMTWMRSAGHPSATARPRRSYWRAVDSVLLATW